MRIHSIGCAWIFAFSGAALSLPGHSASSQTDSSKSAQTSAQGNVRLYLVQNNDAPVVGAEVSVKSDKVQRVARSDSSGLAKIDGLPAGSLEIHVRRLGFKEGKFVVPVASGDNAFTLTLDEANATLDEIRVVSKRSVGRLADFDARIARGEASAVVTAAQIDKRNPVKLSQMLRGMAGLRLADSLGSIVAISTRGQKMVRGQGLVDCVMRLMIDGIVMPAYTSLDATVPKDVYGVEVFNGPSRIPVNFGGMRTDNWCGLIAIWTRSG